MKDQHSTNNSSQPDPSLLFDRGVAEILPSKDGLAARCAQGPIRLYLGIDPTGATLTLGHAVVLRKLQQFLDAGHEVILLIGNATVRIGDPTGRDKTRPELTDETIEEHWKSWSEQASIILDMDKVRVVRNGDWLDALRLTDLIKLLATTTVQQLIERDMFQDRLKANLPIFAHELIYPLLQGYDSVELEVDLEIGGNDQTFNMMFGRTMLKQLKQKEKWVLITPLLVGSDGRKMGKSLNNFIPLADPPNQIFIQLMQVKDEVIPQYLELLTSIPSQEVEVVRAELENSSVNPIDLKKRMAFQVIAELHDEKRAQEAQEYFERTIQEKEVPENLPEIVVTSPITIKELMTLTHSATTSSSQSENLRLLQQGAVRLGDQSLSDPHQEVEISDGMTLRIGKKHWYTLRKDK